MPDFDTVKNVVLFLLALYGAALSTFNWRQATRKDRRSILVQASTAMPTYGSQLGPPFAQLEAINIGHRVVNVTLLTFETEDKKRLFPMAASGFPKADTPLPVALADGQSATRYMSYQELGAALIHHRGTGRTKLTPVCEDSTGGIHRGKPWDVDPKEFITMQ